MSLWKWTDERLKQGKELFKITCLSCGEVQPFRWRIEYGEDTFIDERYCNGISCGYYDCPDGFCYSDYPQVNVKRQFIRVTCPNCERTADSTLHEEVSRVREPE